MYVMVMTILVGILIPQASKPNSWYGLLRQPVQARSQQQQQQQQQGGVRESTIKELYGTAHERWTKVRVYVSDTDFQAAKKWVASLSSAERRTFTKTGVATVSVHDMSGAGTKPNKRLIPVSAATESGTSFSATKEGLKLSIPESHQQFWKLERIGDNMYQLVFVRPSRKS